MTTGTPGRCVDHQIARRIAGRTPRGFSQAHSVADRLARQQGVGPSVRGQWLAMVRLTLAARDADGEQLVTDRIIDQVLDHGLVVVEVLRRAESLVDWETRPATDLTARVRRSPPKVGESTVSCADCDAWGLDVVCGGCHAWRKAYPPGRCMRCRRHGLPLVKTLCRCCTITAVVGDHDIGGSTQLWFGGSLAPRLYQRAGALGYQPVKWRAMALQRARRATPTPISEHLIDPDQLILLDPPRRWDAVTASTSRPPSLTADAAALLNQLGAHGRDQGWNHDNLTACRRTLRILLAHLGADAPLREADIRAVASTDSKGSALRALHFLAAHHTVIADATRQLSPDQRFVDTTIASMPTGVANELQRWVDVARGLGRRAHPPLNWCIIRNYLAYASPVIKEWAGRVESLREITAGDVATVLAARSGNNAQTLRTALRSIFRALKQERLVFADPTRGVRLATVPSLPAPLSSDTLHGLIERADHAIGRLAIALVAVHGLGITDLRALRFADLDATRGRLRVTRAQGRDHLIYLDRMTHRLALVWLQVRHENWPRTQNPHLLITGHSAISATDAPIAGMTLRRTFSNLGVQPSQLREDRILNEAALTSDPVHLIRLFGISPATAMHYVTAAHPERHA
ncbi:MAG: hypothetical protein DLM61_17275 [Pseudonocardiales bacterium]|nr:MAG: hypothetical protein DLM61_17275 [Pseudonocardiales bacterium]